MNVLTKCNVKFTACTLLVLLLVVVSVLGQLSASAAPIAKYKSIANKTATISVSGTTATCTARLAAKSSMSLSVKMVLQKKTASGWSNVKTWSASGTDTVVSLVKTQTVSSSGTYRLQVTFTAGGETITQTVYA